MGEAGELDRRVDGLRPGPAEEHPRRRDRRQPGETVGKLVGERIGERLEARVRLERADLRRHGVGDVVTAVTDVAVPQAGHGIDQLGAIGRPEQGALAANHGDERRPGRFGERMEKAVDHDLNVAARASGASDEAPAEERRTTACVAGERNGGRPVAVTDLQSSTDVEQRATTVTVVTWNVQGSAGLDVAGVADVVARATPDVVVMQEIGWWQSRRLSRRLG